MISSIEKLLLALVCGMSVAVSWPARAASPDAGYAGVAAFNLAFDAATRKMDTAATLALWQQDGVSLLPSTQPVIGKPALARFMRTVMAQLAGGRMTRFDSACHDIRVSGAWASEWCSEHQQVSFSDGRVPFEGWGKLLLVLHRGVDGHWRLATEMWNQGLPPAATPAERPSDGGARAGRSAGGAQLEP